MSINSGLGDGAQVVGDDAPTDPAFHPVVAVVATARELVPAFEPTDAPFDYGTGGAIGGAVASAIAREGARLFLSRRNAAPVQAVANDSVASGGVAETATVDALKRNGG